MLTFSHNSSTPEPGTKVSVLSPWVLTISHSKAPRELNVDVQLIFLHPSFSRCACGVPDGSAQMSKKECLLMSRITQF